MPPLSPAFQFVRETNPPQGCATRAFGTRLAQNTALRNRTTTTWPREIAARVTERRSLRPSGHRGPSPRRPWIRRKTAVDEESTIAGAYERGFDWWKHTRGTSFAILRGEVFSPKCRTIADSRMGQTLDWSITRANQKASMPRSIGNPIPSRVKAKKRDRNRTSAALSTWQDKAGRSKRRIAACCDCTDVIGPNHFGAPFGAATTPFGSSENHFWSACTRFILIRTTANIIR